MNVDTYIASLVQYGLDCGLLETCDRIYVTNQLLQVLGLDSYTPAEPENLPLEETLKGLLDDAVARGICGEDITSRDLFDTKLMGILTPAPREVRKKFASLYRESPKAATDWYYQFSQDTDYIRRYRIQKDMRWKTDTEYGALDITINLSKPEKDPKAIAAAKNAPQSGYPKCLLCVENEGYSGRMNHPARQNHRIIPLEIAGQEWFLQYSPYVYYNEHCIAFNAAHTPMKIDRSAFEKLLDFVTVFPHYFIGSNADLPIVGGSILSHEHFQGGRYCFPMEQAPVEREITFRGFKDVKAGLVKWPMSVIRLDCPDKERLVELADKILKTWRGYSDEEAFIFAESDGEPHNTITPIARRRGADYELDLVLRNNITTEEHPLGVYHPHAELHHIKKENIGLIEVMGLAVLPSRLKGELAALEEAILTEAEGMCMSETPEWLDDKGKIIEHRYCRCFLEKQPMLSKGEDFFTTEGVVTDKDRLLRDVFDDIKEHLTGGLVTKAKNLLEAIRMECYDRGELEKHQDRIFLANGTLFLDGRFVEEKGFCLNRLPIRYNPNAPQPEVWLRFLSELLEPEDILTLQEFMGYCLIPCTRGKVMLLIKGNGGEGKSRIGVVMHTLFGPNAKNGSIDKVETSAFARADLQHVLVMVDDDTKMEALSSTHYVKSIITAETPMDLERKKEQSFQGDMYVRFMAFSNGDLEALYDKSEGFFRRQLILQIRRKPPGRVDDPFLSEELKQEAEGIFLWCLDGLRRLQANNYRFTVSQRAAENKEHAKRNANNLVEFMQSEGYIQQKADSTITSRGLYAIYQMWCEDNGYRPIAQRSVSSYLKSHLEDYNLEASNKITNKSGKKVNGFWGIQALTSPIIL